MTADPQRWVRGLSAAAAFFCFATPAAGGLDSAQARAWIEGHALEAVRQLGRLASMPSLATNPEGLAETRAYLSRRLEEHGFSTRELRGDGVPVLFAQRQAAVDAPTLLLYFHYDGQEVDPSQWRNDPFEPTLYSPEGRAVAPIAGLSDDIELEPEQRVFARAVADDKGPIAAFLVALDLLAELGVEPAVHLKVFMEGDEESGSPGLPGLLREPETAVLLEADGLLILDAPQFPTDEPTVFLGGRGIVTADLTVWGPQVPLHSGHYGNWAVNPATELARLLASMVDEEGRILVEHYYDDRLPLSEAEKAAIARLPPVEDELRRKFGVPRSYGGEMRLYELITFPSLNVRGLRAMYVGRRARTVIPDRATAALDLRFVPGQSPEGMLARLEAHLVRQGYRLTDGEPTAEERATYPRLARLLRRPGGYGSFRTPLEHPTVQQTLQAVERATGAPGVVLPTIGGSGPLVFFKEILGLDPVGLSTTNHDCNQHAADENLRLRDYFRAIRVIAGLLAEWGAADQSP